VPNRLFHDLRKKRCEGHGAVWNLAACSHEDRYAIHSTLHSGFDKKQVATSAWHRPDTKGSGRHLLQRSAEHTSGALIP